MLPYSWDIVDPDAFPKPPADAPIRANDNDPVDPVPDHTPDPFDKSAKLLLDAGTAFIHNA